MVRFMRSEQTLTVPVTSKMCQVQQLTLKFYLTGELAAKPARGKMWKK
jgi:hypothetical protein